MAGLSLIPFLSLLSGGLLALVILHRGLQQGLIIAGLALGLLCGIALYSEGNPMAMLVVTGVTWSPIVLLAGLLRGVRSLTLVYQVAAILALVALSLAMVWIADPVSQFGPLTEALKEQFSASGQELPQETWDTVIRLMPGIMTGLIMLGCLACLFFGRVWQDTLEGTVGRFGAEFRQIKLGTVLTSVASLIMVAALLLGGDWVQNATWVLAVLLLMQGLSVVHHLVADGGWPAGVLFAVYGMLMLVLQLMLPLLAVIGFLDNWFDLRLKLARRS